MRLMVYPKVLSRPNFSIKRTHTCGSAMRDSRLPALEDESLGWLPAGQDPLDQASVMLLCLESRAEPRPPENGDRGELPSTASGCLPAVGSAGHSGPEGRAP